MQIGIIVNPKSGRNKAKTLAQQCQSLLTDHSHKVLNVETGQLGMSDEIWESDRLIIIGGDGTVHHALPKLIKHQIPFYHLGTGTSNLISKELGMPQKPAVAVEWVEQGGEMNLDVPTLDGVPFLIMCNFGMDAGVIHRFEQSRTKSGGFRNYIIPVTKEFFNPRPASIRVQFYDNPQEFSSSAANITIANMRSYALSINPCPNADPTDGKLDILSVPCSLTLNWSFQTNLSRLRLPIPHSQRYLSQGLEIHANKPTVVQFDGEIAITPGMPNGILQEGKSITVKAGELQVQALTPNCKL